ncbi:MAG: DUF5069 domain-containing protein [Opitutales bacterium]|nr:DUF5069 domain-containing protein [Opitutales bacterium]MCH8540970.1 DUF5069 domain-containing protein [Opitutales bacterium]
MPTYNYQEAFSKICEKAVDLYHQGGRNVSTYFDGQELEFIRSIGAAPIDFYDYAEDYCSSKEPDFSTFLLIQAERKNYFLYEQNGQYSTTTVREEDLPAKDDEAEGIAWLPRIIEKARAKLKGEMPSTLMYCCGGDRRFLKSIDMHPAEFLVLVRRNFDDTAAIVKAVKDRKDALENDLAYKVKQSQEKMERHGIGKESSTFEEKAKEQKEAEEGN